MLQLHHPGTGYTKLPRAFQSRYIYLDQTDISGYQVGETITGGTSSATATIIRKEEKDGRSRLVVKRTHTDVNQFVSGEIITGGTSGTERLQNKSRYQVVQVQNYSILR